MGNKISQHRAKNFGPLALLHPNFLGMQSAISRTRLLLTHMGKKFDVRYGIDPSVIYTNIHMRMA